MRVQDQQIGFRANDALVAALSERARRSGCSLSEYLRAVIREKIGLN